MSIWQPKFLFWIIFLFVYLLVIFTFFYFFIDFDGYFIVRTDEGQPRPKYIFNKCRTNIYFLLYRGLVHHHHEILKRLQCLCSKKGYLRTWEDMQVYWEYKMSWQRLCNNGFSGNYLNILRPAMFIK